ncbi:MAG: PSD1 and planctomycete cytochrome C domain-containing protein [Planctomycetota bacterium]|nr:PSD1 and planctomycete cytochrome C domain-containing protein [Planctomycetota bacterium]
MLDAIWNRSSRRASDRRSGLVRAVEGRVAGPSCVLRFQRAALILPCFWLFLLSVVSPLCAQTDSAIESPNENSPALTFFESKVRPLLIDRCFTCHSAETNSHGGLRVDDRNGLLTGGGRGPAVVPGKPDESLLLKVVEHADGKPKMPSEQPKLADEEISVFRQWIADGAVWTRVRVPESLGQRNEEYEMLKKQHWAWQSLSNPAVPTVGLVDWPRGEIDRFVLAKLEQQGLAPVGDADKRTLLRRVTFDLTGLPPTQAAYEAFLADVSHDALDKVVDGLLASPQYAERWGRHWLDVARYGESTGSARNLPYPHAWRYRDYVISAVGQDKPYDQFVREQIAGDLLPASSPAEKVEQLIATGFLAVGVKDVNQRFKVRYIMDNVDEQIDTVSRAILGLTASCARCHDHKFDPIPITDYYALAGIFCSTEMAAGLRNKMGGGGLDYYDTNMLLSIGLESRPAARQEELAAARNELQEAQATLRDVNKSGMADEKTEDGRTRRQVARQRVDSMQQKLLDLSDPAQHGPIALGVREAKVVSDTEIRIRGEAEKLGPVVPRGFLGVVPVPDPPKINPRQSGRLELADWLTDSQNPLTSRVYVNRVWLHLFGRGIVKTPDNFGTTGDTPSHPELLDHLANQFVRNGWSTKKLIRQIVLSRSYQLAATAPSQHLTVDPDNALVWRHAPRRLDAEEIRDATLAASGELNLDRPEGSPAQNLKVIEIGNNGAEAKKLAEFARASRHRSVYLPLVRTQTPTSLAIWDFAEQGMVTGSRDATTVAPQALYQLNNGFVLEQAKQFAQRVNSSPELDDRGRTNLAWRLAFGRSATDAELELGLKYLADSVAVGLALLPPPPERPDPPELPRDASEPAATTAGGENRGVGTDNAESDLRRAAWVSLCQALLSAAEFRYVQ